MNILVTGGTGFIATRLVPFLIENGHSVRLLLRPTERGRPIPEGAEPVEGNPLKPGPWWEATRECDAAINMAGAPIFARWTPKLKALIRESRLATTRNLVDSIPSDKPFTLVSTSAVGIYGNAMERECDEDAPLGNDFLATVAKDWEAEALRARDKGTRVAITRFAIVFGPRGGALQQLTKVTRRFLSGPVGSGRQWLSWIHREDLVRAILFLLEQSQADGPFNLCSPNPVRQAQLAKTLGRILHRPAFVPAPTFAVRLALGEFADAVLFSQKMVPRRLVEAGFSFHFPDLEGALRDILGDQKP